MAAPTRPRLALGIDLGSHGARAVVTTGRGQVVGTSSVDFGSAPPARRSAQELWDAVCGAVNLVPAEVRHRVWGLGVTGVRGTVIGMTDQSVAATPCFPDFDAEFVESAKYLSDRWGRMAAELTGCPITPLSGLVKIFALRGSTAARYWLTAQDYVTSRMTGVPGLSTGSALRMGVLARSGTSLCDELLRRLGLAAEQFPEVFPLGAVMGRLSDPAAGQLGLYAGLPVLAAPGDFPAAMTAAGALSPGVALVSFGTTTVLGTPVSPGREEPEDMTLEILERTLRSVELGGGFGGATLDWLAKTLGAQPAELDRIEHNDGRASTGTTSMLEISPYILDPWSEAGRCAITGISTSTSRADLVRACGTSVAREALLLLDRLQAVVGQITRLYVTGGASRLRSTRRHIEATFEGSVIFYHGRELAAEGAAAAVTRSPELTAVLQQCGHTPTPDAAAQTGRLQ